MSKAKQAALPFRRQRTLSHAASQRRQRAGSDARSLNRKRSAVILRGGSSAGNVLTTEKILEKTYYNVDGHQPESLDWFNVLIAQTIAQLRADALDGDAVLTSLTNILNGPQKPDFLDDIKVTEISLGEEFPIFSNCRVIPVDEDGLPVRDTARGKGGRGGSGIGESRLQARMDVDLSDVVTLGVETKLVLNYPKPFVAVLPVALAVSVVRFSGTLSVSFTPSQPPPSAPHPAPASGPSSAKPHASAPQQPTHSPTTLTFTFLDDYRLDLSVHSLVGSRARLQDVPKIAQLVEQRLHAWFDERCVEPRFQQIVLPSLWPRKKNVRGGDSDIETADNPPPGTSEKGSVEAGAAAAAGGENSRSEAAAAPKREADRRQSAARARSAERWRSKQPQTEDEEELAEAGAEIREAEERDRERQRRSREHECEREREGMRRRMGGSASASGIGHGRARG
ncbi:ERMES complex subunit mmm1 [Taxawa tesnikishii (nom. ined.)]|nr:ERMES complex subunit mmm1 [Dothideales sp. JES 119]